MNIRNLTLGVGGAFVISALCLAQLTKASEERDSGDDQNNPLAEFIETGESRRCINPSTISSIQPIDDRTLLFRINAGQFYLNRLSAKCNGATSPFRRIQYTVRAGSLCRNEPISVVDNSDNITTGFCRLGEFERLERREKSEPVDES